MLKHLDDQVRGLATKDDELRRDPTGIGMGLVLLVAAVVLGCFAVTGSGRNRRAGDLRSKKVRDEKGRIVR